MNFWKCKNTYKFKSALEKKCRVKKIMLRKIPAEMENYRTGVVTAQELKTQDYKSQLFKTL